jgi:hypothetical protein
MGSQCSARRGIASVKANTPGAAVVDQTGLRLARHPGAQRLGIDELDVCRAVDEQRFMGTRADESPAVDDDHLVG